MEKILRRYVRAILREQAELPPEEAPALPKGEWVNVEPGDPLRDTIQQDLYDLVQATYADIGGHFKIQSPESLGRYQYNEADTTMAMLCGSYLFSNSSHTGH